MTKRVVKKLKFIQLSGAIFYIKKSVSKQWREELKTVHKSNCLLHIFVAI